MGPGGALATSPNLTRKIFLAVGYFDLGGGERNLVPFLIRFLLM